MSEVEKLKQFAENCSNIIRDNNIQTGAQKILTEGKLLPEHPHPMVATMLNIAYKIVHNEYYFDSYKESVSAQQADWKTLKRQSEDLLTGQWRSTTWSLYAYYLQYSGDAIGQQGYSLIVGYRNGLVKISTGHTLLYHAVEEVFANINPSQSEQRLLENLAFILPSFPDLRPERIEVIEDFV